MKKEGLIRESMKRMMISHPLSEITVKNLCSDSGVKRQTFYYHFQDVYDVLASIYLNEKIENLDKATNWAELVHYVLVYIDKNRQMIVKTLKSGANDVVESFLFNSLYAKGIKFIEKNYKSSLSPADIRDVAKMISDTLSREISRLLLSYRELSIAEIEDRIDVMFDGVLDLVCENKKRKKVKKHV